MRALFRGFASKAAAGLVEDITAGARETSPIIKAHREGKAILVQIPHFMDEKNPSHLPKD